MESITALPDVRLVKPPVVEQGDFGPTIVGIISRLQKNELFETPRLHFEQPVGHDVIEALRQKGYKVDYDHPNTIKVSWYPRYPASVLQKLVDKYKPKKCSIVSDPDGFACVQREQDSCVVTVTVQEIFAIPRAAFDEAMSDYSAGILPL